MSKTFVIAIAGGSGSGKSTLAEGLKDKLQTKTDVIHLDDYFIAKEKMPIFAGESNYDDPVSIDHRQLVEDLEKAVLSGENQIVIVEGFLVLHFAEIRKFVDLSIYLSAQYDVITDRRVHFMWDNYRQNVLKPMYEKYVVPSAQFADVTFDAENESQASVLEKALELVPERLFQTS